MSTENWAEERIRLVALLGDFESGKIIRFEDDGGGTGKRPTTAERVAAIKQRLAALDERLGSND